MPWIFIVFMYVYIGELDQSPTFIIFATPSEYNYLVYIIFCMCNI